MLRTSSLALALLMGLVSVAHSQDDGPRLTKIQERQKFHATPVKGMAADLRIRAYEQRLKLKAESPFGELKWRNIGPSVQSGRVLDIKASPANPGKLFVAFATGGLWTTEDDGITWTSIFDNQSTYGIGAIALSDDGKTVWVGSGEANSQRTSYAGTGVFKSADGGKTWQNMGLPESHHIGQILIDPKNPDTVYVAVLGHLYSQNPERGVYRTTDGGNTWKQVLKVDEYTGAIDLVMDPKNPKVLIASMWDRDRRAWNFRESGKGSGVYRTDSGGDRWSLVPSLPSGDAAGRTGLALCASNPNVVYAFVDNESEDADWDLIDENAPSGRLTARRFLKLNDAMLADVDPAALSTFLKSALKTTTAAEEATKLLKDKKLDYQGLKAKIEAVNPGYFQPDIIHDEIYRSDNGGKSFRRVDRGQIGALGGYYWGKVWVNPKNPDDVYVMGLYLLRSQDGGKNWKVVFSDAHADFHAVWNDLRDPNKVWVGEDGGLVVSQDGGTTLRNIETLNVGQTTTLALDNKVPYNVYVGLQDNGTMKGPSTYQPGKSDVNAWKAIYGGDGSHIAIDPRNGGDTVYVAYQFGEHSAINQATGERWRTRAAAEKGEPTLRYNWISPLVISNFHPDMVYLGSQRLYRSFNQGRKWDAISPDLTKNRPNGDVPHSTIKDISESPLKFGLIYVGTDDGNVKMTPDNGNTWVDIATPEPEKWVSRVVASKYSVDTVYVSQSGYREDDFRPMLWKSTNRGATWISITGNLPNETINVVREDPNRKDILYVGTDMGVYVSYDGGLRWETLHGGIVNTPVHDIAIQARDNELVAATHARSAWVLPLKYVHALTPEIRAKDLTIMEAEDMVRAKNWGYAQRSRWESEPLKSPALPVALYAKSAGKGVVRIKDKTGKVLCEKAFDAALGLNFVSVDLQIEAGKPVKPTRTTAKTAAEALADPYEAARPKYIPVGEYELEVQVGTVKVTKPWKAT